MNGPYSYIPSYAWPALHTLIVNRGNLETINDHVSLRAKIGIPLKKVQVYDTPTLGPPNSEVVDALCRMIEAEFVAPETEPSLWRRFIAEEHGWGRPLAGESIQS